MGYRSDVYLKTTKDGYRELDRIIRDRNEEGYRLFTSPDKLLLDGDGVTMEWNYIKWYDGYDEIDTIDDAINSISDKYPVHFVRIGEDMDDIEERWY